MKITRGRGVAEQVARARRVARSKHDGATSGKRAACFGLSLKTGKKRVASASDDVPDAENPEEIEDALPASPVPPSSLGSAATHQDRELEALAESIKRMYAGYVNEFVKEVRSGFFFRFRFRFSSLNVHDVLINAFAGHETRARRHAPHFQDVARATLGVGRDSRAHARVSVALRARRRVPRERRAARAVRVPRHVRRERRQDHARGI
jgi:hypothetical protein